MLIAVDGNEANVDKRVGVSVYTLSLLNFFQKWANYNLRFKIFLKATPKNDLPKENKYFQYSIIAGKFLWSQISFPLHLAKIPNLDLLFAPAHYSPFLSKIPLIVTIHDLSFLYFPEDFLKKDLYQLRIWTFFSIKKAKKIIAVSQTTKKDLIKNYHIPEEKIIVVYNGFNKKSPPTKIQQEKVLNQYQIQKGKYILYVGTLQPRKNIVTLLQSFFDFQKENQDFKLVIAGKKGWLFQEIFAKTEKLGLKKKVVFTDYVSDKTLSVLYHNAFSFVFPSFYEGFGLPILEALSLGCPVIAANSSALPEIGGDACLYFDPKNHRQLTEKLFLIKKNNKIKQTLIKKGKKRIKKFSWESCAYQTITVFREVLHEKKLP